MKYHTTWGWKGGKVVKSRIEKKGRREKKPS